MTARRNADTLRAEVDAMQREIDEQQGKLDRAREQVRELLRVARVDGCCAVDGNCSSTHMSHRSVCLFGVFDCGDEFW